MNYLKNISVLYKQLISMLVMITFMGLIIVYSYYSISLVDDNLSTFATWSEIDMVVNEAVTQNLLRTVSVINNYEAAPTADNYTKFEASLAKTQAGLVEWKQTLFSHPELLKEAESLPELFTSIQNSVMALKGVEDSRFELVADGDTVSGTIDAKLNQVMEGTIDPAKEKAEQMENIPEMVRWGAIDMVMNEGVIAPTLRLITAVHDYGYLMLDEALANVHTLLAQARDGLKKWEGLIGNEAALENAARLTHDAFDTVEAHVVQLSELVQKRTSLRLNIDKAVENVLVKLDDVMERYIDPAKEMAVKKANEERSAAVVTLLEFGLGLLILGGLFSTFLAFYMTNPLRKMLVFSDHVFKGNLEEKLNIHQADEYGQLADALRAMVGTLKNKIFWYESILDSIPFPLSVTDSDLNWTFVNAAALQITGAKRDEILGKQCKNWGADICGTDRCGVACLKRGEPTSWFTQPGLNRDFRVDAAYLTDWNGQNIGHVEVVQDITEANELKRKAEQALKEGTLQAASKLESVVAIISSASAELSAQIEQSSNGLEEQADRIHEVVTAMEQMNASVLEIANSAAHSAQTSEEAKNKSVGGLSIVNQVVASITQVSEQSQTVQHDMANLGEQAQNIGQVLNVISDIADQTNLLALNAAIEAARAGDAGRGFAVVADEVRKLAEKTMQATQQVGDAIRGIQESAERNISSVERTGNVVDEATALARQAGDSLHEITDLVDDASSQVNSIAAASEEQSATSEEINRSVENVNRISMENSEAMRQSAQAISELAEQAQVLQILIDEMKQG